MQPKQELLHLWDFNLWIVHQALGIVLRNINVVLSHSERTKFIPKDSSFVCGKSLEFAGSS